MFVQFVQSPDERQVELGEVPVQLLCGARSMVQARELDVGCVDRMQR